MLEGILALSRSMSTANKKIFSTLIEFASANNIQIRNADEIRYIKSNKPEKSIITDLKIQCRERLDRSIEFAIGKLDQRFYLIVVGPKVPEENIGDIFEFVSMDAGWFTSITSEMEVDIAFGVSIYETADILNDRYRNAPSLYKGHHFSEISQFFQPISVFVISSSSPIGDYNLHRIAGAFLCERPEFLNLEIPKDLITDYEKLFIEGPDNLPFEELLNSLTSLRWKDAFLDVYRCIERLFPYSYIQSLHNKTTPKKTIEELIGIVEEILGWKVKENLAIELIFSACNQQETTLFRGVKKNVFGNEEGSIGAELIYQLRNSIVHHRLRSEQIHKKLLIADWVSLIRGLLIVTRNEYIKYHGSI